MYKAISQQDWAALARVVDTYGEYSALGSAFLGVFRAKEGDDDEARRLLSAAFKSGEDPAAHPFAVKYLTSGTSIQIAPGVTIETPINRNAVGLLLAELHQENGDLDAAVDVVEQVEPTVYAAVSLAELYSQLGRFTDVIDLTDGLTNSDDATALLCTFRGAALREQRHFTAARETLKEALKSRKREPLVRHRALLERAMTYLAEGKRAQARKDLERILAEDSDYQGLETLLTELDNLD